VSKGLKIHTADTAQLRQNKYIAINKGKNPKRIEIVRVLVHSNFCIAISAQLRGGLLSGLVTTSNAIAPCIKILMSRDIASGRYPVSNSIVIRLAAAVIGVSNVMSSSLMVIGHVRRAAALVRRTCRANPLDGRT
jgi:hypothetical protein